MSPILIFNTSLTLFLILYIIISGHIFQSTMEHQYITDQLSMISAGIQNDLQEAKRLVSQGQSASKHLYLALEKCQTAINGMIVEKILPPHPATTMIQEDKITRLTKQVALLEKQMTDVLRRLNDSEISDGSSSHEDFSGSKLVFPGLVNDGYRFPAIDTITNDLMAGKVILFQHDEPANTFNLQGSLMMSFTDRTLVIGSTKATPAVVMGPVPNFTSPGMITGVLSHTPGSQSKLLITELSFQPLDNTHPKEFPWHGKNLLEVGMKAGISGKVAAAANHMTSERIVAQFVEPVSFGGQKLQFGLFGVLEWATDKKPNSWTVNGVFAYLGSSSIWQIIK